jgi:hypothetical protein
MVTGEKTVDEIVILTGWQFVAIPFRLSPTKRTGRSTVRAG